MVLGVAGLVTTLAASLGASYIAARSQYEVSRRGELRTMLDHAAERLAAAEASGRYAWRILLELDLRSAKEFDEIVRDESFAFPEKRVQAAVAAVDGFAAAVDELAVFAGRLELRLRQGHPAVAAFASARDQLSSTATTMAFGAAGSIRGGQEELNECLARFYSGLDDKERFLAAARNLVA